MLRANASYSVMQRWPLVLAVVLMLPVVMWAQTTVSTGSIVGTVTDPSGAVVSGAKITITNVATGQNIELTANSAGAFNSGAIAPGTYKVQVSAKGFNKVDTTVSVQVGNTATVNTKMTLGQESTTIEVQGSSMQVNTEQAIVQGVLTSQQIENLPVNGRNFLDLAQLEPGVQIQDGQNFDPTKAGYSSISFGGRFGRTARINVDGVDVSDETVGTTTADIPASAIDEFQLSQSSLDLSNDLTSSGSVNVTTKSGTNTLHGEGFYFVRDHSFAATSPGGNDYYLQRHQFGGKLGGPIIKDKLFFFLDGERTKQDAFAAVQVSNPLSNFSGGFSQPFRENNLLGKMDYNFGQGAKAFYRYSYFENLLAATFGLGFEVYDNKDYTRQHVVGLDMATGSFSHSFRFSYLKFQNGIVDATLGNNSLPLCCTGLDLKIGTTFFAGPNHLAPQATPQSNHQIKYDGSRVLGRHLIRYGVSYNHIQGGGFASFYQLAPRIRDKSGAAEIAFANTNPFGPGGSSNPLNFPVERVTVGNGLGFNTLEPALGFPAGGLGPDNRLGLYVGDSWKIKPNFTVNAGLRWDRDTGRTDSDLPAIPEINAAYPGYGNPVRQPNKNFAPQIGFAWDPKSNGKTVIRGGIGLFYENVIYNNVLFDRPLRLRTGAFNQVIDACNTQGQVQAIPINGGQTLQIDQQFCGENVAIGNAAPGLIAFEQQYQSLNPLDLQAPNPNFVGNFLAGNVSLPVALFGPKYQSPRSLQMNIGIQREIRHGMVLSADYLRNVTTHTLAGVDVNRVGDTSFFDKNIGAAAISSTLGACGASSIDDAVNGHRCAALDGTDSQGNALPVSMVDFANFGLTSSLDFGGACATNAPDPNPNAAPGSTLGHPCAFGGINPNVGQGFFLLPIGRAVYNALQVKLSQNVVNPVRGIKAANFQIAYSLSRYENSGGTNVNGTSVDNDQDFVIQAADNNNVNKFFGPGLLDRTHQLSFGGYLDVPFGFRVSTIAHFYSPLSGSLVAPASGLGNGEIFRTDFTGDGTIQDAIPGTHFGEFDRGIDASQLTGTISKYNTNVAGQVTPAGQVLIDNGLFTLNQLQAIGGVAQPLPAPVPGQVNFSWLRSIDLKLTWRHTFKERFTIEPSVGFYNAGNFSNFNLPPNTMSNLLDGSSGSLNGTDRAGLEAFRVGNGTGVYSLGSQRQIEFGMRLLF